MTETLKLKWQRLRDKLFFSTLSLRAEYFSTQYQDHKIHIIKKRSLCFTGNSMKVINDRLYHMKINSFKTIMGASEYFT